MTGTGASAGDIVARDKSPRPGLRVSEKAERELFSSAPWRVPWPGDFSWATTSLRWLGREPRNNATEVF
jgi:hypothetical protein